MQRRARGRRGPLQASPGRPPRGRGLGAQALPPQLLDAAPLVYPLGGDITPTFVGEIRVDVPTLVAVTVDVPDTRLLRVTLGDARVSYNTPGRDPFVVEVPAGRTPVLLSGLGADGMTGTVHLRSVRDLGAASAQGSAVTLHGTGDMVLLHSPAGAPATALRLASDGSGVAAALAPSAPPLTSGRAPRLVAGLVQSDGPAQQGLPLAGAGDAVLVWAHRTTDADAPATTTATVSALSAHEVDVPAGSTTHVTASPDAPVLLRLAGTADAPLSFTTVTSKGGHVVPTSAALGVAGSDPVADPGTYLATGDDQQVASFTGTGLWGTPSSVELDVHAEKIRALAQPSTTALQTLAVDQPGLVYDLSARDLEASAPWALESGMASTVTLDACTTTGLPTCVTYAKGTDAHDLLYALGSDHVRLVAHGTGTWSWRLVALQHQTLTGATPKGTGDVTLQLPAFTAGLGRVHTASCSGSTTGEQRRPVENLAPTARRILVNRTSRYLVQLPQVVTGGTTLAYALDLGAYDGVQDGAGASGAVYSSPSTGESYGGDEPSDTFGAATSVTVQRWSSVDAYPGQDQVWLGPDTSGIAVTVSCDLAYVPTVTA